MKDPQQELFTALLIKLKKVFNEEGIAVYDTYLPPSNVPYPFIYIADTQFVDDYGNKQMIMGTMNQVIQIWSDNPKQRGTLSDIMADVKNVCRSLSHTETFAWVVSNINQRVLADTSTGSVLLQGILEIDFKMIGGTYE